MTLREAEIERQAAERRLADLETRNVEIARRMTAAALTGDSGETARAADDFTLLVERLFAAQCDLAGAKIRLAEIERAEIAGNPEAASRAEMLAREIAKARLDLHESIHGRYQVTQWQIARRNG